MMQRVVTAVLMPVALAACSSAPEERFACESGHDLALTYDDAGAHMRLDSREMELARVSDTRYRRDGLELRVDGDEGPRVIEGDQVTVWGCVPADD